MRKVFVYGSLMYSEEVACCNAEFDCKAKLPNHKLTFPRKSKKRCCGVAGIDECSGCEVWGVVYRVSDEALKCLDNREGYDPGRNKRENSYESCEVTVLRDGDESHPVKAFTYYANPQKNPPLPNDEYKALLVKGAKERKLPGWYIECLRQIKTAD